MAELDNGSSQVTLGWLDGPITYELRFHAMQWKECFSSVYMVFLSTSIFIFPCREQWIRLLRITCVDLIPMSSQRKCFSTYGVACHKDDLCEVRNACRISNKDLRQSMCCSGSMISCETVLHGR